MADLFVSLISIQPTVPTASNDGQGTTTVPGTTQPVKQGLYGDRRKNQAKTGK